MSGSSCDFGSTTFASSGDDAFVTRLDAATGSFVWADQMGGAGQDGGNAIALDGSGNVYTTGGYGANNQTGNFDPHGTFTLSPGKAGLAAGNYREAYVSMLDANGNFLGAWQTRAAATDGNDGWGVAADSAGNVWASGGFSATTTFPTGQTLPVASTHTFIMQLGATHGAILGNVWNDLSNNGARGTYNGTGLAEPPLAGWTVYATPSGSTFCPNDPSATTDVNGSYQIDSLAPGTYTLSIQPPAGWSGWTTTKSAGTVTVGAGFSRGNDFGEYKPWTQNTYTKSTASTIKGSSTTSSTLSVADSYKLQDLSVQVNLSFPADSSLTLYLVAPDGTQVQLAAANGGSGANFTNTTFNDGAATSISGGSAPFSGTYRPLWQLGQLDGKSVQGTWTLQVVNGSRSTGKINSWSLTATHATGSSPQLAAAGVAPGGEQAAPTLTEAQLAPVVRAAVERWAAAGLSGQQLALLQQVQFSIKDLSSSGELAQTSPGSTRVVLDATADGWGWFVDPTPDEDSEFATPGAGELRALAGGPAFGRMDLLTVVEHELGHVLGLDDLDPASAPNDLMTATLATGTRRLPDSTEVALAMAGAAGQPAVLTPQKESPAQAAGSTDRVAALDAFFAGLSGSQLDVLDGLQAAQAGVGAGAHRLI